MKRILVISFLAFSFQAFSQTSEDSVKNVINHFFSGMKNSDSAQIRSTLASTAIFQTIKSKQVQNESILEFLNSVSKNLPGSLDERIVIENVKVDGDLASVWTPYYFYYGGKFSHCGVNSFQLVRLQGIWKIQYIIDTRRKQNCDPK